MAPDYRKTLPILQQEWNTCTKCELGMRRADVGGSFVFGEGTLGGILFVGEGPGKDEEQEGRPFVGKSGTVLRDTLEMCGLTQAAYITNCVACRSCAQSYSSEGQPLFNERGMPIIKDCPPIVAQMQLCSPRLYEEIYMVDPVLIVALGGTAAEFLLHRSVNITSECKTMHTMKIPGAMYKPSLTEKKRQWIRKVHGEWSTPVEQNMVEYPCILNVHPAYVLRNIHDERPGNPSQLFYETMQFTKSVYEKYISEVFQIPQE